MLNEGRLTDKKFLIEDLVVPESQIIQLYTYQSNKKLSLILDLRLLISYKMRNHSKK